MKKHINKDYTSIYHLQYTDHSNVSNR